MKTKHPVLRRAPRTPRPAPARRGEGTPRAAGGRLVLPAKTAKELMTVNPVSIPAESSIKEAAALLTDRGFGAVPAIDVAGRPGGVISRTDIVRHEREREDHLRRAGATAGRADRTDAEGELLPAAFQVADVDRTTVRDVMTPMVFTVKPETPAPMVALEMVARNVHRLFVTDNDGTLVGVVTTTDIVRKLTFEA